MSKLSPRSNLKSNLSSSKLSGLKSNLSSGKLSGKGKDAGMKKNRISFGNSHTLLFEKDVEDDEQSKNAVWYSQKEMKTIRKDLKTSIKQGDISRGLEQYEGDMGLETKMKRLNHIRSILDLQKDQQAKGVSGEKGLHQLSRALSSDDIRQAQKLASKDSTEAFSVYKNSKLPTKARNAKEYAKKTEKPGGLGASNLLRRARKSTPNMFLQGLSLKWWSRKHRQTRIVQQWRKNELLLQKHREFNHRETKISHCAFQLMKLGLDLIY